MNDMKSTPKALADPRAERLRAALRENLKRRKAQAKGRAGGATGKEGGAGSVGESPEAPDTPNSAGFALDKGGD